MSQQTKYLLPGGVTALALFLLRQGWNKTLAATAISLAVALGVTLNAYDRKINTDKGVSSKNNNNSNFGVRVSTARTTASGQVEFKLETQYESKRWFVWRPYHEFFSLKERLGFKNDSFPAKSSFLQILGAGDKSLGFVERRKSGLSNFVRSVCSSKEVFEKLVADEAVKIFFGVPEDVQVAGGSVKPSDVAKTAASGLKEVVEECSNGVDKGRNGWELYKTASDGLKCYLKKENGNTYAMGVGIVNASPRRMLSLLIDASRRTDWDELFNSENELEKCLEFPGNDADLNKEFPEDVTLKALYVKHTKFNSPASAIVAERDSCTANFVAKRESDGALLLGMKSIEHPKAPVSKASGAHVRAQVACAGFVFEKVPGEPNKAFVSTCGKVDPGGHIPAFIVNTVAPQRAFVIREMAAHAVRIPESELLVPENM